MFKSYNLIMCLLLSTLSLNIYAQKGDADQPIQIEADEASLDHEKQLTTYSGKVIVVQGSLRMEADKISVSYNEKKQLKKLIASTKGKKLAHFQQKMDGNPEPVHAYAKTITYNAPSKQMVLEKQAKVIQMGNEFKGSYIVYDAGKNKIKANKGRVRATIQPPK